MLLCQILDAAAVNNAILMWISYAAPSLEWLAPKYLTLFTSRDILYSC